MKFEPLSGLPFNSVELWDIIPSTRRTNRANQSKQPEITTETLLVLVCLTSNSIVFAIKIRYISYISVSWTLVTINHNKLPFHNNWATELTCMIHVNSRTIYPM